MRLYLSFYLKNGGLNFLDFSTLNNTHTFMFEKTSFVEFYSWFYFWPFLFTNVYFFYVQF